MKVILDKHIPLVVKTTALRCFVTVTQVMIQFPPHQVRFILKTINFVSYYYVRDYSFYIVYKNSFTVGINIYLFNFYRLVSIRCAYSN